MKATTSKLTFAAAALLMFASCSEPTSTGISGPLSLAVVSGDGQSAPPGSVLPNPVVVVVKDDKGKRVRNQIVNFRVVSGGGSTYAGVAITNNDGIAQERWTLGQSGVQQLEARAIDPETGAPLNFATFYATLQDGAPPIVSNVVAQDNPTELSSTVFLSAIAADVGAAASGISAMEYRVAGGAFAAMTAGDGAFGGATEAGLATFTAPAVAGTYPVCVRARDGAGNTAEACIQLVVAAGARLTIGGTVSGLAGTLVLRNNGGDDLTIAANGSFTFATSLSTGTGFNVTVRTQPAGQTCSIFNASGIVGSTNVTAVNVICTNLTYSVGGTVSNLVGVGCTLRLNGGSPLTLTGNGPFAFPTQLPNGSSYTVAVASQPTGPNQTCSVTNGNGIISGASVTNIGLNCTVNQAACASAITLSSIAGDNGSSSVTANGTGSAWYRVRLTEQSDGDVYLSATIALNVPAGADYDLYVYCISCGGALAGQSVSGTGVTETVSVRWDDDFGFSDDADIIIEVRYYNGSSPNGWSLHITGNTAVTTNTCDP